MPEIKIDGYKCERCEHEWAPRDKETRPTICPACKSPYWDRPRMRIPSVKIPHVPGSRPEWLQVLAWEVPKTQGVKWQPRWTQQLLAKDIDPAKGLRVARALAGYKKKYKNYYLTFMNWYDKDDGVTSSDTTQNPFGPTDPDYERRLAEKREQLQRLESSEVESRDSHEGSGS